MPHATIYYQPDGYVTTGQKLMGRQAAGVGFLRAAAQSDATRLLCHTDGAASARHFSEQLANHGFRGQSGWVPVDRPSGLADDGCLSTDCGYRPKFCRLLWADFGKSQIGTSRS
jgi:hypothetical protein